MFQTLINAFKNKDVRNKIFLTLFILLIYRLGAWLPVPGINGAVDAAATDDSLLGLMSAISGGALRNGAFLAIGISPYINASIIMQLLTVAIPGLEKLSKQGDAGKKKLTQITRVFTLILALAQAIGIVISWHRLEGGSGLDLNLFGQGASPFWVGMLVVVILVAGTSFTTWLGEKITDIGVGNGISLLIFIGIISTGGQSILDNLGQAFGVGQPYNEQAIYRLVGFLGMVLIIFVLIVYVDLAVRKVPIQYAKQIKGRKQYGGQSTHIPIKINASGVLPIIFAMAIVTFPQLVMQIFNGTDGAAYRGYSQWMGAGQPLYYTIVGLLILGFSYFYAQIQFNPEEVARNIQQYGGFIPGIRAGKPTSEYLGKISRRLTFFGAIFLTFVAVVPSIIFGIVAGQTNSLVNAFSATGLLIVVSVALEFDKQLENQLMMKNYKGFLK